MLFTMRCNNYCKQAVFTIFKGMLLPHHKHFVITVMDLNGLHGASS